MFTTAEAPGGASMASSTSSDDYCAGRPELSGGEPRKRPALERSVANRKHDEDEEATGAMDAPWMNDPKFTARDVEKEWAAVTPDEMLEIEADLRGLNLNGGSGGGGTCPPSSACQLSTDGGDPTDSICPITVEMKEEAMLPLMEAELAGIPNDEKAAYLEARRKCPRQVDDEHKKGFLLKVNFDPKLAADRLVRHWKYRRELFGPAKCYLPMTLSGAMSDDMVTLSDGFIQLLPNRDEHGRAILYAKISSLDLNKYSRDSLERAFWYLIHVATEDPNTRRSGIIYILNHHGMTWEKLDTKTYRRLLAILFNCMTSMARATHVCHPQPMLGHITIPILRGMFKSRGRKRLRVYTGSDEDVLASLAEFGLGADRVPRELGGSLDANPVRWLSNRMLQEASSGWEPTEMPLVCVNRLDVGELASDGDLDSIFSSMSEGPCGGVEREPASSMAGADDSTVSNDSAAAAPSWELAIGAANNQTLATEEGQVQEVRPAKREDPKGDNVVVRPPLDPPIFCVAVRATGMRSNEGGDDCRGEEKTTERAGDENGSASNEFDVRKGALTSSPVGLSSEVKVTCGTLPVITETFDSKNSLQSANTSTRHENEKGPATIGDPRMARAVNACLDDPSITLLAALIAGGFDYPASKQKGVSDKDIKDSENVSLRQRKNQLSRRLRNHREKYFEEGQSPSSVMPIQCKLNESEQVGKTCAKGSVGDPRMVRAVEAKVANPSLSLMEALVSGGFDFPESGRLSDRKTVDTDGVSLMQRKNQLCRRLRKKSADDPRMCHAVEAKLENPQMSWFDALLVGGFLFPDSSKPGSYDMDIRDSENVSLLSRKSELMRRVRLTRERGSTRTGNATENVSVCQKEKQRLSPDEIKDVSTQKQYGTNKSSLDEKRSMQPPGLAQVVGICDKNSGQVCNDECKDERVMGLWLWGDRNGAISQNVFTGF